MTKKLQLARELVMPADVVTQKINVLGQSGGGKTYTAMKLAELMLEQLSQIVVIDLVGVWWGLLSSADGQRPGFPVTVIGGEHAHLPITPGAGALVADLVVDRGVSVVLDVSELLEGDVAPFVTAFVQRLFHRKKKNKSPLHVFFEEAQELVPEQPTSKAEMLLRATITRMCKIGRNYGIGYTVITQEPQAASKRVLNQAGTIIAVRTIGKHERDAIAGTARSRATSKEALNLVDVLPELQTGEAIVWSPAWLKHAGKVHVLPKVTFDSSKTPEVGEAPREPKVLAQVELEQLRTAMAAVVAEAEAQDPTALQRRVRQLEAELAARPPPAPAERIEVPVITAEERVLLKSVGDRMVGVTLALVEIDKRLGSMPGADLRPLTMPASWGGYVTASPMAAATANAAPAPRSSGKAPKLEGTGLKKGAREMLRELAALHPKSLTRRELATRVVMAHAGGSFGDYLSALRSTGFIEDDESGDVRATAAGKAAAVGATAKSSAELVALWKGSPKLKRGARQMLDAALSERAAGFGARPISREQLADAAGMEVSGGSFGDYLSALMSSGCLEKSGAGYVAGHALFLGGR